MLRKRVSGRRAMIFLSVSVTPLVLPWRTCCVAASANTAGITASDANRTDLAVIVNPKVPDDNLSMGELRRIMMGDKQFWTGDQRVTVLVPAAGTRDRSTVMKVVYQMTETQYRQFWLAKRFRQEALSEPKAVDSDRAICALVASVPGTIGIIDNGKIPSGVKVLHIDKQSPGQKDYPVH